ncbi:hypothetical protein, partial [Acidaminococcus sp.]|uniref:hypothetical protein n=1 Tax=Acidaminococcus sp. TaxID=1872103 RepID=UPI003AB63120
HETRLRVASNPVHGCQANFLTYLYVASNMRAMPENEKPPATRVDSYFDVSSTDHQRVFS